mmetsp:Transcript_38913/g.79331  ORF Transcript_38913/g.79331 Transcript_38913/m.79331 type:complete len:235 (-) Transcript_38913:96-800(-)
MQSGNTVSQSHSEISGERLIFFSETAKNLNNVGASLLEMAKHDVALEAFQGAMFAMRYFLGEEGEEQQQRTILQERLLRATATIETEESPLCLIYGSRHLHPNPIKFSLENSFREFAHTDTNKTCAVIIFNLALAHQLCGYSQKQIRPMRKSLSFCRMVLSLFHLEGEGHEADQEMWNNLSPDLLSIVIDVLSCMEQIHYFLGQNDLAEECFQQVRKITVDVMFPGSSLAARAA